MSDVLETQILISNRKGLHARSSAKLVKEAEKFDASVIIIFQGQQADATSIMDLLMLGAGSGSTVLLRAEGPQAQEAMAALIHLIEIKFEEDE